MSWLNQFFPMKKRPAQQAQADFSAAEKTPAWQGSFPDSRAGENSDEDSDDIPSVNRKKGGNIITIVGFVVIVIVFMVYLMSQGSSGPKTPKRDIEKPVGRLPILEIPASPPPPVEAAQAPFSLVPTPSGAPVAVRPAGGSGSGQGKPEPTWYERKMEGGVLATETGSPPTSVTRASDGGQGPALTASGATTETPLGSRLKGSITPFAVASTLPNRNFLITQGTSLDCALETAINSTLPGISTCRLTRDVYSDDGKVLLLDRGTQFVGEHQGDIKQGQARIFILWTRAKTPTGVVVTLNSPGSDALGRGGMTGHVNSHFWKRFGAAIMLSLVGDTVRAAANGGNSSGNVYYGSSSADQGGKIIEKVLEGTVNIPPTLEKNQGDHIQIMVARDLDFSGVYALESTQ